MVDPGHGLTGWGRTVQEDAPGATLTTEEARALIALPPGRWEPRGAGEEVYPERVDHWFVYERYLSERPPLRERLVATVGGDRVTAVDRSWWCRRRRAARRGPGGRRSSPSRRSASWPSAWRW